MSARARSLVGIVGIVALAILGAACDSPTGPDGFTIEGTWTGSWQFMSGGTTVTDGITATISQNGGTASGTWMAASGPSGTLTLTPTNSTAGTVTIIQTVLTGRVCSAATTAAGTASGTRIELTLTDFPPDQSCPWATTSRFVLTRP